MQVLRHHPNRHAGRHWARMRSPPRQVPMQRPPRPVTAMRWNCLECPRTFRALNRAMQHVGRTGHMVEEIHQCELGAA